MNEECGTMLAVSPQVGELLLQATQSQDLDETLHKVLREYLALKLHALSADIRRFEEQSGCSFAECKDRTKADYSYDVERVFWEWEQLETLKAHYQALQERWN